jgi:hypothetical protein
MSWRRRNILLWMIVLAVCLAACGASREFLICNLK